MNDTQHLADDSHVEPALLLPAEALTHLFQQNRIILKRLKNLHATVLRLESSLISLVEGDDEDEREEPDGVTSAAAARRT